jgi:hypothetical protein
LKQYKVLTVRSVLGKVTVLAVLSAADAWAIPGQAAAPEGHAKLVVDTLQSVKVVLIVVLLGKPTTTEASVEAVTGWAQTVPVVAVLAFIRSKRTVTLVRPAAEAKVLKKAKFVATSNAAARITLILGVLVLGIFIYYPCFLGIWLCLAYVLSLTFVNNFCGYFYHSPAS